MCKHIINSQISILTPCCRKWYECPECHDEHEIHKQRHNTVQAFTCKNCKKVMQKDLSIFDVEDCRCPHCGIEFVLPAATPESRLADLAIQTLDSEMKLVTEKF